MTRIALSTLGLAGVLALTGCGATMTPVADVAPAPSHQASAGTAKAPAGKRAYLRKNTLHGEIVVQGKDGKATIVVQRGTVTASDAKSLSVKSADGFNQTWTLGDKVKIRGAVAKGAQVGVAGRKDGGTWVARLVTVKK
ncbi:hypothetical protein [Actinoplanes sp. TFC3]|uniref:hypothetical protein n=1 Tax=Actinoplanes sp. TFC3 TaxID=1710355 RepID=UPI000B0C2FAE|nr:hypothetical protein [Actinoplanes sp. TFC3]